MEQKLKFLALVLLDDEEGISEQAYEALLDILPELLAQELDKQVNATDRRYYLPVGHTFAL